MRLPLLRDWIPLLWLLTLLLGFALAGAVALHTAPLRTTKPDSARIAEEDFVRRAGNYGSGVSFFRVLDVYKDTRLLKGETVDIDVVTLVVTIEGFTETFDVQVYDGRVPADGINRVTRKENVS